MVTCNRRFAAVESPAAFGIRGDAPHHARDLSPWRTGAPEAHRHRDLWKEDHVAATMEVDPALLESLRALGDVQ